MTLEKLFQELLGLGLNWEVVASRFEREGGTEIRAGGAGVWAALRRSQWLWRKNPENLTESEQARLAKIDQKNLCTARAYQMRLVLQDIYRSATTTEAGRRFRVGVRWVRWVARIQPKNLLRAMVKVADLVENHLAGILAR